MRGIASTDSSFVFAEIDLRDAFGVKTFAQLVSEKTLEHIHFDGKRNVATLHYKGGLEIVVKAKSEPL